MIPASTRFVLWILIAFAVMGLAVFTSANPCLSMSCVAVFWLWVLAAVWICPEIAID